MRDLLGRVCNPEWSGRAYTVPRGGARLHVHHVRPAVQAQAEPGPTRRRLSPAGAPGEAAAATLLPRVMVRRKLGMRHFTTTAADKQWLLGA